MAVFTGVLFGVGAYLMLQKRLLRLVIGTTLMSHGALMAIITLAGLERALPPFIQEGIAAPMVDPLPQALILTAIVIGLGVTAFLLVLAYRTYQTNQSDDLDLLRNEDGKEGDHD